MNSVSRLESFGSAVNAALLAADLTDPTNLRMAQGSDYSTAYLQASNGELDVVVKEELSDDSPKSPVGLSAYSPWVRYTLNGLLRWEWGRYEVPDNSGLAHQVDIDVVTSPSGYNRLLYGLGFYPGEDVFRVERQSGKADLGAGVYIDCHSRFIDPVADVVGEGGKGYEDNVMRRIGEGGLETAHMDHDLIPASHGLVKLITPPSICQRRAAVCQAMMNMYGGDVHLPKPPKDVCDYADAGEDLDSFIYPLHNAVREFSDSPLDEAMAGLRHATAVVTAEQIHGESRVINLEVSRKMLCLLGIVDPNCREPKDIKAAITSIVGMCICHIAGLFIRREAMQPSLGSGSETRIKAWEDVIDTYTASYAPGVTLPA